MLGSESMAGGMQSYVGSTKAHQDIFRDRIEVYRRYIENVMNEQVLPRLVAMGYVPSGLEFRYSNRIEMSNEDRIKLYSLIRGGGRRDREGVRHQRRQAAQCHTGGCLRRLRRRVGR